MLESQSFGAVATLPPLGALERRRLLVEWNATFVDYPMDCSVLDWFSHRAHWAPDSVALIKGDVRLSYAELDARSNKVARFLLRHHPIAPNSLVGLCVERSVEMVVGLLGALKAGAAYLPLDPRSPSDRLATVLNDACPQVILTDLAGENSLPAGSTPIVRLDSDWPVIDRETAARPHVAISPASLAYVVYTSGSTGRPKGVLMPHSALTNHMLWMRDAFPLRDDDVILQKTPLVFDASIWEVLAPLLAGAKLVLAEPEGHKDPRYLVDAVRAHDVTTLQLVPSMLRAVLEVRTFKKCTTLRNVFSGGEPLASDLRDRFFADLGAGLHNLYGPSETCIQSLFHTCKRNDQRKLAVPIGRPIANTQAYVLDDDLDLLPIGAEGELYIGGAGLSLGYLGQPSLTRERFVANPYGDAGSLLYRTGDRVRYLSHGELDFLGRVDRQVKLHGYRIELGEIEAVLATHPGVREAVVTTDQSLGITRLIAHVVSATPSPPPAGDLRDFLRHRLPEPMIPSVFASLADVPRLPSGKTDRAAIVVAAAHTCAGAVRGETSRTCEVLAEAWAEVLKVPRVGVDDDFFDLGGNSMAFILAFARVNERLGTSVGLEVVRHGATIATIAQFFDAALGASGGARASAAS